MKALKIILLWILEMLFNIPAIILSFVSCMLFMSLDKFSLILKTNEGNETDFSTIGILFLLVNAISNLACSFELHSILKAKRLRVLNDFPFKREAIECQRCLFIGDSTLCRFCEEEITGHKINADLDNPNQTKLFNDEKGYCDESKHF